MSGMMTKADVMECSNETLALWTTLCRDEMKRRKIDAEAVALHPGQVINGRPVPAIPRVVSKVVALSPSALARVEALVDALRAERTA